MELLPLNSNLSDTELIQALVQLQQQFSIGPDKLCVILNKFLLEFEQGLTHAHDERSNYLPMIPTYVQHVPDGTERGQFAAIDLGGTNLRICKVELLGNHRWTMSQTKVKVSDELKTGSAEKLFDYIAKSVHDFLSADLDQEGEKLKLGLTFSFPVDQTAIDAGALISWTKGYSCEGAEGKDIVELLQHALDRKGVHAEVVALVNDTAGTLMARAYESGGCLGGGIFGTGTNGAYLERVDKISKLQSQIETSKEVGLEHMIINTEWGAFDNARDVLPITSFDNGLDRLSNNPRRQAFEKMISGMYLGELCRNVIVHFIDHQLLFKGHSSPVLNTHYGFDTSILSQLELITDHPLENIRKTLIEELKIDPKWISDDDCHAVARISEIVSTRGCRLSACAIAAVVRQIGEGSEVGEKKKWSFGLDGSLIEHLPRFEERMRVALKDLLGEEVESRIDIALATDGSGIGAALCAQAAMKQREMGL